MLRLTLAVKPSAIPDAEFTSLKYSASAFHYEVDNRPALCPRPFQQAALNL
jgi:hypothetical protein